MKKIAITILGALICAGSTAFAGENSLVPAGCGCPAKDPCAKTCPEPCKCTDNDPCEAKKPLWNADAAFIKKFAWSKAKLSRQPALTRNFLKKFTP